MTQEIVLLLLKVAEVKPVGRSGTSPKGCLIRSAYKSPCVCVCSEVAGLSSLDSASLCGFQTLSMFLDGSEQQQLQTERARPGAADRERARSGAADRERARPGAADRERARPGAADRACTSRPLKPTPRRRHLQVSPTV